MFFVASIDNKFIRQDDPILYLSSICHRLLFPALSSTSIMRMRTSVAHAKQSQSIFAVRTQKLEHSRKCGFEFWQYTLNTTDSPSLLEFATTAAIYPQCCNNHQD